MTDNTREKSEEHPALTRRQLIQACALACTGLIGTDVLAGRPSTARQPGGPVRAGHILSEPQMRLLRDLVDVIIPQTDTPGAAAADTHGFIDDQLAHCRAPEEALQFVEGLDQFNDTVRKYWGAEFPRLSVSDKQAAMAALARQETPFTEWPGHFFGMLKALTVVGYYSSEAGASQELVYLPIPGGYLGSFRVSDNDGKAFSPPVF